MALVSRHDAFPKDALLGHRSWLPRRRSERICLELFLRALVIPCRR